MHAAGQRKIDGDTTMENGKPAQGEPHLVAAAEYEVGRDAELLKVKVADRSD